MAGGTQIHIGCAGTAALGFEFAFNMTQAAVTLERVMDMIATVEARMAQHGPHKEK